MVAPLAIVALAGCGGSSSSTPYPTILPASSYELADFHPTVNPKPGVTTTISFVIRQPNGKPLTSFREGAGPHTGVHIIIVRDDLADIIHMHPSVKHLGAGGIVHLNVVFPAGGPWRMVVDVYPNTTGPQTNFQLFHSLRVAGAYRPKKLPPFSPVVKVRGYTFVLHGKPDLKAVQASFINVTVTDPQGKPVTFVPWYGALAHAIFFRQGSLDYFHTHICSASTPNCTSLLGRTAIKGTSTTPGKLTVGVLVPAAGTWRLFLQCKLGGLVATAPFTLEVH
ncbi:MAG TPA: hypothetical protein VG652_09030 [Gaiellaceae bacterium]|nr:hypothetical protein [Gaiellaceae bacterium]